MDAPATYRTPRLFAAIVVVIGAWLVALGVVLIGEHAANALVGVIGLGIVVAGVSVWRTRAVLTAAGIEYRTLLRGRSLRWTEIAEIERASASVALGLGALVGGLVMLGASRVRLVPFEGKPLGLAAAVTRKDIVARIETATLPHLLVQYQDALRRGAQVGFGHVSLNRKHLVVRKAKTHRIPVDEIERHRVKRANLGIRRLGSRRTIWIPLDKVTNAHVLLALLDESAPARIAVPAGSAGS